MSYEQRKKNRQRREKRYKIFIISIGIILFTIILFSLINIKRNTILAVEDVFLKEIELQSVLIKSEKVFTLEDTKDIDTSILEGKKIPAGIKVGNSTVLNDLNLLRKELKEVEKAISTLTNTNKDQVFKNDKKKLKENYNQSIEKIQEDIYSKNYKNIKKYKEEIILIDKDLEDLLPQNTLLGQSIDNLNDKKKNIKEEINQKDSSYISESSGIISYRIDGYENILKPQGFENYTYDKLSISNKSKEETVGRKEKNDIKGFKIIDNFEWYLALKIDDRKNIQKYEIGDELFIKYPFKNSFMEIKGDIISINNTSNKSVIILKFNKYLHDLYNDRFPNVKLVQKKIEALKIPNDVILEQDGIKGVYIKAFSGIVKFKPIKIISKTDDYTYIDKGQNGIININNEKKEVETISIYNEIILKPNKFKEGQIID